MNDEGYKPVNSRTLADINQANQDRHTTRDSSWEENVEELARRIKERVRAEKKEGTVSMSRANLRQLVSTSGLNFANANGFERALNEAIAKAGVSSFVHDEAEETKKCPRL